jgi:hypothetical protein
MRPFGATADPAQKVTLDARHRDARTKYSRTLKKTVRLAMRRVAPGGIISMLTG